MAESIEQLSFELTSGALAEQERALSGLRARAGTVLAAASVAGSFFGVKTSDGSLGVLGVLATISFALCVGSAIWILLPHSFVFAFRGKRLLAESDRRGESGVASAYRTADMWVESHLDTNRRKIDSLADCLAMSCALLVAEVIIWTFSLIG